MENFTKEELEFLTLVLNNTLLDYEDIEGESIVRYRDDVFDLLQKAIRMSRVK